MANGTARKEEDWKLGRQRAVLILLFALLGLPSLSAHASDSALELGDYLAAMGSYDAAITEYKRFLFFHPEAPDRAEIYRKIGLAYREERLWVESADAFRKAIQKTSDREAQAGIRMDLAVTLMASGELNLALLECVKAESQATTEPTLRRARFLIGLAHLHLYHWEQAQQAFRGYYGGTTTPQAALVDAQLETAMALPRKSERTASLLSTFLPGAGQIYAGEWKNGLNAFALNAVLLSLTIEQALEQQFDNAALLGLWLFQRYYGGNRYRASEAARNTNEHLQREAMQRIVRSLSHRESAE